MIVVGGRYGCVGFGSVAILTVGGCVGFGLAVML
jgi:hypothetical protein